MGLAQRLPIQLLLGHAAQGHLSSGRGAGAEATAAPNFMRRMSMLRCSSSLDTEVEERGADLRGKGFGRRRTGWGPAAEDQSGGMEGRRAGCGRWTADGGAERSLRVAGWRPG